MGREPAGRRPAAGLQPRADGLAVHVPAVPAGDARGAPDIPLWDPYIMGGRPFQANSQSAVFSPFSVPAYVLPFWKSLA